MNDGIPAPDMDEIKPLPWHQSKAIEYIALGIAGFLISCGVGTCIQIADPEHAAPFFSIETKKDAK